MSVSEYQRYQRRERRIQSLRLVGAWLWMVAGAAAVVLAGWAILVGIVTIGAPR